MAFGVFIVACGFTHFVDVLTIWIPVYVFSAGVKIVTATAALMTAAALPSTVPRIRLLVHKAGVCEQRQEELRIALSERDSVQSLLEQGNRILEVKVRQRIAEFEKLNEELRMEVEDRKRISVWLAQSAAIVESSNDAIIRKDLKGKITTWNRGAQRLYGYTAEEAVGKSITMLIPRGAVNDSAEILRQAGNGQAVEQYETARVTKDGRILDIALTVSPIRDAKGVVIGVSAIARDVTARNLAEGALRESESQYRTLFESCPLPMWVFDRNTFAFLAVNEAAVCHYGYSRSEFLAMNILDIETQEEITAVLQSLGRKGHSYRAMEAWQHRRKDGSAIKVEVTTHPVMLRGIEAEMVLARDVTETLEHVEKLRQSEERFSKAFRSIPMAVTITTEADGRYLDANDSFMKWMGYKREEVIGKSLNELHVWDEPRDRELWAAELERHGRVTKLETQIKTHSGEVRLVEAWAERIHLDGEACFLAILHDVTEEKRQEEQFRQAQKMEAVGRLAGGVAHDFNNMLGVILGYSELAVDCLDREHPARRQVEQIRKASQRAAVLTRQLLAFSRQQVLQPTVLNLNAVVYNMSKMLVRLVGEDVSLHFTPGTQLGSVQADLGQVEQVLMNLSVNARDAMPRGGRITIETSNAELDEAYARHHPSVRPGFYVLLTVSDTGCGMDSATALRIFEPFFTTKPLGKGTGLGLSIVYGIVKQSEGHVWVYSEPGRGTSFKIYLPRVDEVAESLVEDRSLLGQVKGGSETVMLVEDDESLRALALKFLEDSGYRVLEADDPRAAIEISNQHKGAIDLMVTDVIMPVMSGIELARFLSTSRPELKVLYISGYTGDVIARHGILDAATHLVEKPFTRSAFLTKVRHVIDGDAGTSATIQ